MANDTEKRLLRVLDHIHDNPAADLSLDALADVAALSRFHFHRVFHATTGETVAQSVRRLRMYRASVSLVTTKDPVARIARSVGYPNMASFHRTFTEATNLTPAAFRARGELRPVPPTFRIGETLMYPVEIRDEPARILGAVPHKGPYPEISRAFAKLGATLGARNLLDLAGQMVGVYYDDPAAVPASDLTSHAGIELPETAITAPLEPVRLPAGPHAVLRYPGPYTGLPAAYDQLFRNWLPGSGRQPANSPIFEVYLNTPMDTSPEDLITEICLPLTPA
ncbi:MAG: AraC family transcriptional regulator [Paracoccaceae bacterium]